MLSVLCVINRLSYSLIYLQTFLISSMFFFQTPPQATSSKPSPSLPSPPQALPAFLKPSQPSSSLPSPPQALPALLKLSQPSSNPPSPLQALSALFLWYLSSWDVFTNRLRPSLGWLKCVLSCPPLLLSPTITSCLKTLPETLHSPLGISALFSCVRTSSFLLFSSAFTSFNPF